MDHGKYWSESTNPRTGAKFAHWLGSLRVAHNGEADVDRLIESEYGAKFAEYGNLRFLMEEEPMGEACLAYYRDFGVRKEMYNAECFYERWSVFSPLDVLDSERLPLVIWNHGGGNAIEVDEFAISLTRDAGAKRYVVVMAQNTNWQNISEILDKTLTSYPIDPQRVYIMGFSQGGHTTNSAVMRMPWRFAAAAPCGVDIIGSEDNQRVAYTLDELLRLRYEMVPMMQMVGACEMNNLTPLNRYRPRKDWGANLPRVSLYRHPDGDYDLDPTNPGAGLRSRRPVPFPGIDPDIWKLMRLNLRLDTLNCEPRDIGRCLALRDEAPNELQSVLGFYGDREEIRTYYGYKHYILDIDNRDGMLAFRYIALENGLHYPGVMLGELAWEFFRQYRRDEHTGKVVVDPYIAQ